MNGPTFQRIDGHNVIAAPHASHGGIINNYFSGHAPDPKSPSSHPRPFSTVPFLPDPHFVDRPAITARLRDHATWLSNRVALAGLGGIG
jgi:hypothetical protein